MTNANLDNKVKYIMAIKLTTKGVSLTVMVLIPLLSLAVYCGVLKSQVNHNKTEILKLEGEVKAKDIELQAQLDTKVDIVTLNATTQELKEDINQMRVDNIREHDQIQQSLIGVGEKLDKLILRGDK